MDKLEVIENDRIPGVLRLNYKEDELGRYFFSGFIYKDDDLVLLEYKKLDDGR